MEYCLRGNFSTMIVLGDCWGSQSLPSIFSFIVKCGRHCHAGHQCSPRHCQSGKATLYPCHTHSGAGRLRARISRDPNFKDPGESLSDRPSTHPSPRLHVTEFCIWSSVKWKYDNLSHKIGAKNFTTAHIKRLSRAGESTNGNEDGVTAPGGNSGMMGQGGGGEARRRHPSGPKPRTGGAPSHRPARPRRSAGFPPHGAGRSPQPRLPPRRVQPPGSPPRRPRAEPGRERSEHAHEPRAAAIGRRQGAPRRRSRKSRACVLRKPRR